MKNLVLALILMASAQSFAMTMPLLPSDIVCVSKDKAFRLDINLSLGVITVYDNIQKIISNRIVGLIDVSTNGVTKLENRNSNPDLKQGVVFEARLKRKGYNAFSIDDKAGKRTEYSVITLFQLMIKLVKEQSTLAEKQDNQLTSERFTPT